MNQRLILVLLCILPITCFAEEGDFSESYLKYSLGIGYFETSYSDGGGLLLAIGYEHQYKNQRIRFNPNLLTASYSSRFSTSHFEHKANSVTLETLFFYDLIKYKCFSLPIGTGLLLNRTSGLTSHSLYSYEPNSNYYSSWNYGAYIGAGIRINPKKNRIAFEIFPLSFHFGPNYFVEGFSSVSMVIKLKK